MVRLEDRSRASALIARSQLKRVAVLKQLLEQLLKLIRLSARSRLPICRSVSRLSRSPRFFSAPRRETSDDRGRKTRYRGRQAKKSSSAFRAAENSRVPAPSIAISSIPIETRDRTDQRERFPVAGSADAHATVRTRFQHLRCPAKVIAKIFLVFYHQIADFKHLKILIYCFRCERTVLSD